MEKIRVGIVGYGNLGKGAVKAAMQNDDIELCAIFTRRAPESLKVEYDIPVYSCDDAEKMKDKIDVLILCGGSATDLQVQGPQFAKLFNTIDSFDTHAKIPEYYEKMNNAAQEGGNVSIISVGWDPGMFSINRLYSESILPCGESYTFWGKGVSQGHSDAIRRIDGVENAIQYTIPIEDAVNAARSGENPTLSTREKHLRECFVVAAEGADKARIEKEIKEMPNYFADYDTIVHFISAEELRENHSSMPHGGFVIRSGKTLGGNNHIIEYSLKLQSNPEFTSSVLLCYARAAYKMAKEGMKGAKSVFDVPPAMLSPKSGEELRATML